MPVLLQGMYPSIGPNISKPLEQHATIAEVVPAYINRRMGGQPPDSEVTSERRSVAQMLAEMRSVLQSSVPHSGICLGRPTPSNSSARIYTHKTLEDAKAIGRYRLADEDVRVVDERNHEVFYVPPPAEQVDARMADLCSFANGSNENPFIQPITD